jgi:FG-GAP-like repeat
MRTNRRRPDSWNFTSILLGLFASLAALCPIASGQSYLYGQLQLQAGNGPSAFGAVSADFNGDGFPDLAAANSSDNTVSVFLGQSDGSFASGVPYSTGLSPYNVVAVPSPIPKQHRDG